MPTSPPTFAGLFAQNSDTVGIIRIPGTNVHHPVVRSTDNEYYLRRNFNRQSNQNGVIYADYRNNPLWGQSNTIIYGHNRQNGLMFAQLPLHLTRVSGFIQSPFIIYDDGEEVSVWVIFALVYSDGDNETRGARDFRHNVVPTSANMQAFLDQLSIRTVLHTRVEVTTDDLLMTLSTCHDEFFKDARLGIVARKLRPGETNQSFTFTSSTVTVNRNALYPETYYRQRNLTMPDEAALLAALR